MKKTSKPIIGFLLAATSTGIMAGEFSGSKDADVEKPKEKKKNEGDWCETLEDLGKVYREKDNRWIQRIVFSGRMHNQWGYTDGSDNGRDFSNDGYELHRLRLGVDIEFLDNFTFSTSANFNRGYFRDTSIGYDGLDQMVLEYDFDEIGPFDKVRIGYGRHKIGFGGEENMSSNQIKTIERSVLNDEFAGERVTGFQGSFEVGDNIDFLWGIYSTDFSEKSLGSWNGGILYHLGTDFDLFDGHLDIQAIYSDASRSENEVYDYRWAVTATYETEVGIFDLFTNFTYGEDYNGDAVYGFVVMPSTEIIKNKLEAVIRYQWAHSEDGDLRAQRRNTRLVAEGDFGFGIGLPDGEYNQNIYAGLNYFLCDDNAKAMFGVEYERNRGGEADTEATTVWGGLRFYF